MGAQPGLPYPDQVSPVEIYLLDPALLEKPGAQEEIDRIINNQDRDTLTEADADLIECMAEPNEELAPRANRPRRWPWVLAGVLALFGIWLAVFGSPKTPAYKTFNGATLMPSDPNSLDFLQRTGLFGRFYRVEKPLRQVADELKSELPSEFRMEDGEAQISFWTATLTSQGLQYDEALFLNDGYKLDDAGKDWVRDRTRTEVLWCYKPSLAQQTRSWLGW